jgi:hypothetical protein
MFGLAFSSEEDPRAALLSKLAWQFARRNGTTPSLHFLHFEQRLLLVLEWWHLWHFHDESVAWDGGGMDDSGGISIIVTWIMARKPFRLIRCAVDILAIFNINILVDSIAE